MAILGVNDFKAKLRGGGARANLYKVTMNFPIFAGGNAENGAFMCRGASLPGSTMAAIPIPFRGREIKVAGDRTFENWTVTVYNDTDFEIRNAMERWMNGINAHQTNTGFSNPVDYQTDLIVDQLDRNEKILKRYNLRGCFPVNVSAIPLAYDQVAQIEEFEVEFALQYWEARTTS
jgi:hypothetical protein